MSRADDHPKAPREWEMASREIYNTSPRTLTDDLLAQVLGWAQDAWLADLGPRHPLVPVLTELAAERHRLLVAEKYAASRR